MFRQLYFYLLVLVMAFCVSAQAQFAKSPYVKRDPRVDKLVDKQIELNKQALRVRTTLEPGFRILVISTNINVIENVPRPKIIPLLPIP